MDGQTLHFAYDDTKTERLDKFLVRCLPEFPLVLRIVGPAEQVVISQSPLRDCDRVVLRLLKNLHNAFAAFNLGSSKVGLGDYQAAAAAFDRARATPTPWRC